MLRSLSLAVFMTIASASLATAQDKPFEFRPDDSTKSVLEKFVGQSTDLRLKSGERIGGKVVKVGDKLVHLTQIVGAEYFDAVIEIDEVAAVSFRVKK